MVSIEDMLSPTGGSPFGQRLDMGVSGLVGLVAWGLPDMVSPIHHLMGKGAEQYQIDKAVSKANSSPLRTSAANSRARINLRRDKLVDKWFRNRIPVGPPQSASSEFMGGLRSQAMARSGIYAKGPYTAAAGTKSLSRRAQQIQSNLRSVSSSLRSNVASIRGQYASARSFFKGVGWAFAGAFAFDLGEYLFTPKVGISASAVRADERVLGGGGPLDSGAAATMRKRSLQAIFDSQASLSNVIGNESMYYHK